MPLPSFPTNPQPLTILIAEDNVVNQKLMVQMLKHLGYQADSASNGLEVLEALRQQPYDVVLMDVQMPQMDGVAATRQIRQEWSTECQPYIIALTGNASSDEQEEYLTAGMDACLTKPIRMEILSNTLRQCQPGRGRSPLNASRPGTLSSSVLDAEVLADIKRTAKEEAAAFLVSAIDTYLEDAPILLQKIKEAIAQSLSGQSIQQASETLCATAHSFKTMSGFFGAKTFSQICQILERMGKSGITTDTLAVANQLEIEYERVRLALECERQKVLE